MFALAFCSCPYLSLSYSTSNFCFSQFTSYLRSISPKLIASLLSLLLLRLISSKLVSRHLPLLLLLYLPCLPIVLYRPLSFPCLYSVLALLLLCSHYSLSRFALTLCSYALLLRFALTLTLFTLTLYSYSHITLLLSFAFIFYFHTQPLTITLYNLPSTFA